MSKASLYYEEQGKIIPLFFKIYSKDFSKKCRKLIYKLCAYFFSVYFLMHLGLVLFPSN